MRVGASIAAALAGLGLLVFALTASRDRTTLPSVQSVRVTAWLQAGRQPFGDAVPGVVQVLVPNHFVDPSSVALTTAFDPYSVRGETSRTRVDDGATTLVRYRFEIWCVSQACLPHEDGSDFPLAPATVAYRLRDGRSKTESVTWPEVGTSSRLSPEDVSTLRWHPGLHPLPAASYRLPPPVLGSLLGLLGVVAGLGGALLLRPSVRAATAVVPTRDPLRRRSLLERALLAVRQAAAGDDLAERRRALDLLARELRRARRRDAARAARRLAWSEGRPDEHVMRGLADEVEGLEA